MRIRNVDLLFIRPENTRHCGSNNFTILIWPIAVLVGIVTSRDIDFIVEKKDEGASIPLRYYQTDFCGHGQFLPDPEPELF
jgi:hypothetical protein